MIVGAKACFEYELQSQRRESNPQPPHYECGALPIEATLAKPISQVNIGQGGQAIPVADRLYREASRGASAPGWNCHVFKG